MVKRPLIYLLASYILGVLCYYYGSISICILMFLLITFLVFLYFKYSAKVAKKAHLHYFDESKVFIFVPCCYLLGIFFMMYEMQPTKFEELLMNRKESGVVQGKIEEIWRTENGMKLEISDVTVKFVDRNQEETLKYNLVIYDNSNQEYKLGNIVMWEGKISTFEPPGNYGQFDEVMYQKARGIEGVCFAKSGRVIDIHNNYLQNKIQDGKTKIQKVYKTLLNEEDYGIISAMLVGDKQDLSKEIKKLYQKQGMAHILSISGLHISMLGMGFFQILRKLKLKLSFATGLTIGFLFLYGMLTGFALSTIRAIIMLIIKLFATIFGKTYDSISAIAISALILLMKQPVRIFDSGFLLSYGAVFGVFCVSSALVQLINKEGGKIYIRIKEAFFMSLGIQLATLPIVLNFYYEVPLYAPIMNLILLPFMSLLVGQALIGGVIGCFSLTLGKFLLGGVHYQLLAMKNVMEYASKLPFATLILGKPAKVQIILYYSILLSILGVVWCIITIRKEDKEAEGIWDSFRMIKGTVKSQHVVKEKYLMQQQQKNMTSMVETTYLHMKPYFYPVLKKLDYYSPKLSDVMLRISRRKRLDEIVIALCVCLGIILASRPIKGLSAEARCSHRAVLP